MNLIENQVHTQVGCRLIQFADRWSEITQDQWILDVVQEGLQLNFQIPPHMSGTRVTCTQNNVQSQCLLEEVESLLGKQAIERVPQGQEGLGFYSTFFTVQKKGEGLRPILNLRPLNKFLKVQHFKMETLRSIIRAMEIGDWVAALDLKDAYLHIPIFPPHRKFLRFCIENQHFQFKAMPFGLATAPRVFTKVMAAVGGYLRMKEVHIFMYLDDWLLKSREPMLLVSHLDFTLRLLMDLGLVVNLEKSHIWPSQMITYLGAVFNLQKGIVCPTEDRFQNLCQAISILFQESCVPAKLFLRILGLMASCIDLVPLRRLHMRPIQLYLLCHWSPKKDSIFHLVQVKNPLLPHLQWWTQRCNIFKGACLDQIRPQETIWTDASNQGWGAHLGTQNISGTWSPTQTSEHINVLEMLAVRNALYHFERSLEGKTVLIRSDNSTVVCYINRQGGTNSPQLCMIVWNIFQWCLNRNISILAAHIPGKKNSLADSLSRGNVKVKVTEWSLNCSVAETLFNIYTKPNIDLFATKENRKIQTFCSPYPDPEAWSCDALACNWTGMYAYAFPPPDSDSPEGESGILCPTISSTSLTETIVVSNTSQSFDRHANTSTKHRVSTDSKKRSGKTSRSAKPKVSTMGNIRRYKATEKFSERAKTFITNSKRESTRKVYDARLTIYRNWCSARSVSPHSISVSDLAEFFIYLHDVRNCKATTIAGYRSAIASVHKGWHNSTVSNNVSLLNLIKGMFNSNRSVKTLLPNWDLPPVLMSLCDTPFEPLSTCEMKFLTWKTVFLVALATASRVSEIHALSLDSQHLRFEKDGIRLLPNLKFLAKTQRLGKPWSAMFVPEFNTYATDCRDLLLCPCRAVKMYLKRTKSLRKGEEALFLAHLSRRLE